MIEKTTVIFVLGFLSLVVGCTSSTSSVRVDEQSDAAPVRIAEESDEPTAAIPHFARQHEAQVDFDSRESSLLSAIGTQYILGKGPSGIELIEVTRQAVANRYPLGLSVSYGSVSRHFATLSGTANGQKLQIFDAVERSFSKSDVFHEPGILVPITGLAGWIALDKSVENLFYVTMESSGNQFRFFLTAREIATGVARKFPIPSSLFSPRLLSLGDKIGVYNETDDGFATFSLQSGKFQLLVPGMAGTELLSRQAGMDVSNYLLVPGVGIVRVSRQGAVERITNASLEVIAETKLNWLNESVIDPQIGFFEGRAVIAYGSASPGQNFFSEIVLIDPLANTEVARKRFQLTATAFHVANNCQYFLIASEREPSLMVVGRDGNQPIHIANLPQDWSETCSILGPLKTAE